MNDLQKNFGNRPIGSGDIACQSSKKRQNLKIFEIFRKIFRHKNFFKRKFEKKNYWILYIFPRRSRKKLPLLCPTARLGMVLYFVDTGNTVKRGKKNSIFQIGTENTPCDISNALSFITDQKSHTKTKNGGHLCPWGSKICLQAPKMVFKPYFRPLRAQMDSNFRFCV